eukprot:scaffold261448_cov30-Tisochrysis_lutea.AAC.4
MGASRDSAQLAPLLSRSSCSSTTFSMTLATRASAACARTYLSASSESATASVSKADCSANRHAFLRLPPSTVLHLASPVLEKSMARAEICDNNRAATARAAPSAIGSHRIAQASRAVANM